MALHAENLSLSVGGEAHLSDVSFTLDRGVIYTVLGRTLAGKTTLLKAIAGLQELDGGAMTLDGTDFFAKPVWKRNVAMVYQQFINYPHLSVYNNIDFPLRKRGLKLDQRQKRVQDAMRQVGLEGFGERKIQELSGGQQQRVALARSLAKQSEILLLDEPLVNLDYKLREQLREELKDLISSGTGQSGVTIYSTTDPLEAMQFGGQIIVMDEGRILQHGSSKNVFEHPASCRVAEIVNDPSMNLWPAHLSKGKLLVGDTISFDAPRHFSQFYDGPLIIGFRANDVSIDPDGTPALVELSEISGSDTILHLERGGSSMIAHIEGVSSARMGEEVPIRIDSDWLYAFHPETKALLKSPYEEMN